MKVVMTGAAGGVGTMTRPHLVGAFDQMIVSDRRAITELHEGEAFVQAELTDMAAMERLLEGADGIIHLGGQAVEADWEAVHGANIVGLYNTYEAARRQGVQRIVFATTNHVVGFYRRQQTIDHTASFRSGSARTISRSCFAPG
jgi:uronate dehydrogenase